MTRNSPVSAQLEQLKRNAKRRARADGLPLHQVLDAEAVQRGFANWSLLVRDADKAQAFDGLLTPAQASSDGPARSPAGPPGEVGWPSLMSRLSGGETKLIMTIVGRFFELVGDTAPLDRLSVVMDMTACHGHACRLRLQSMLDGRDTDLVHDVAGISRHLNRETLQLEDCFWPRYAMPESVAEPS